MMRQRQQRIVDHIQKVGIASFGELAEMLEVSPFTIRRDIDYLSQSRLLVKIKGGAQRIETASQFREAQLPSRLQINLKEKERIAKRALDFIQAGDTIFLDGSSTIACLARRLADNGRDITVVTNSVLITLELAEASSIRLIGLGGIYDPETLSFVGFDVDEDAHSVYIEKAFFSCTGLIPEEGTFENAAFNRNTKRQIAQRANRVYVLIDSSKVGRRALNRVMGIDEIDVLVTEKAFDEADQAILERNQVKVYVTSKGS